jgi:hypothetical protein
MQDLPKMRILYRIALGFAFGCHHKCSCLSPLDPEGSGSEEMFLLPRLHDDQRLIVPLRGACSKFTNGLE